MPPVSFKRYTLYLIRWQLSTPLLAPIVAYFKNSPSAFGTTEDWAAASVANFIGGLIFFWVDRFIFTSRSLGPHWEVRAAIKCADCGKIGRGYRLVKSEKYDRSGDRNPKFRCEKHSQIKAELLKEELGVTID